MRVLFCNWIDYRDPENRGGGVSVYQRNLIDTLVSHGGVETAFLSAGTAHDLFNRRPHVVQIEGGPSPRHALVNSGVVAPAHSDFGGAAQLDHAPTEAAFADFVDRSGPWDVIHFNNLEGLPANVLSLRRRWPQTRFVVSLHNYYPFCPQVNLWHDERETCDDFQGGARCETCLPTRTEPRVIRWAYAMAWRLSRLGLGPGTAFYNGVFRPVLGVGWRAMRRVLRLRHALRRDASGREAQSGAPTAAASIPRPGDAFARRRARMVALINDHCDAVLCVSDRVRQIALHHGIRPAHLRTLYIGTREAEAWHRTQPREAFLKPDGTLHLAYLGYMRRDKGFHFLMRALAALPPPVARRIHLTVAARRGDADAMAALAALRPRLAAVTHVDGYDHDMLDTLLADVDLAAVPVIWEDNLPQVAIEMHARHIPLLTSDRGGAQELGRCPDLVFGADDAASFHRVLTRILDGTLTPSYYWRNAMAPTSLPDHVNALLDIYRETT